MNAYRILFLIVLFASACLRTQGQRIKQYTSDNSLSSSLVNKIIQDSHGFVWIATEHGLNLFDGTRFKVFHKERNNPSSLLENYVRTVYETREGTLLVGCINGLMVYDRNSDTFRQINMSRNGMTVSPHVVDILQLSTGEIWIATAGAGLFLYNAKDRTARSLESITKIVNDDMISCLYEDSSHSIWIGTEMKGVSRYYPSSNTSRNYQYPEISGNIVTSIIEDTDRSILVGTLDGGVNRYSRITERFTQLPCENQGINALQVKTLASVGGKIYAGTDGQGIRLVEQNRLSLSGFPAMVNYFSSGKIHQIMEDRDGNLWIGAFQKGITFLPQQRFQFNYMGKWLGSHNTIGEGCVMAVHMDHDHKLWVSCDNDGIHILDENLASASYNPTYSTFMCFFTDSSDVTWAGAYPTGVFRTAPDGSLLAVPELADRKTYSITQDHSGLLYIGSLDKGIESYNPITHEVKSCLNGLSSKRSGDARSAINSVNYLFTAKDGNIWVAHYNGISCYDPATKRFRATESAINLVSDCIGYAIHESENGLMWFGTSDGLYSYSRTVGRFTHYTTEDGLPDDVVCGICEDEGGNLWLSTYHGLSRFSPDTGLFTNFDSNDGLQSNEFTHGAFYKDEKGVIYFGGTNGITYFHPYDITGEPRNYPPVITEVGVFSAPDKEDTTGSHYRLVRANCSDTTSITLSPQENSLNILFSSLSYDNPDKIIYEYRLVEHGKKWLKTDAGQSRVTYYNLPSGKYHFELRVEGDQSPEGTRTLAFTILPPWYLSMWAKILYTIIIILAIVIIIVHLKARESTRQELIMRKHTEEVTEAKLQFFTNISHEIRTPMTLIIDPLQKLISSCSDPSLSHTYTIIYRNASRILSLINQIMDVRKLDKGQMRLHARETDLVGFIEDVMMPFGLFAKENNIVLIFNHEKEKMTGWIDLENFDKVLMNLLSNAFKYTPAGGTIQVTLQECHDGPVHTPLEHYIQITVSDTGNGIDPKEAEMIFERFYRIDNATTQSSFGTGIGLHLVKSIVMLHHGEVSAHNREEGVGAEFTVKIPLHSNHLRLDELAPTTMQMPISRPPILPLYPDATNAWKLVASKTSRRHIVVVEDDDDIRTYLHSELKQHYSQVTVFSNGDEALHAILSMESVPDLIISDVMIPGIDGITLTRKIKQNVNTNHTPVILLSAKSTPEEIKTGMESGADHYMVKPFSSELLMSTIENLLSNRHLLKAKFSGSQEQSDKIHEIKLRSQDEMLMKRVMDVINDNIASSDFGVEKLAKAVGLSRAHLHRKMKEYTDLSARDFIKSIRMRQAARLLKEKKLSIAEVAYATGFANPSHFSNSFKEVFGVTPTRYAATKEEVQ